MVIGRWAKLDTQQKQRDNFKLYSMLAFSFATSTGLFVLIRAACLFYMSLAASRRVHDKMIDRVFKAPINKFFDATPTGTLLNRFSKDLQTLDQSLVYVIGGVHVMFYQLLAVLIVILWTNWYIVAAFPFILMACFFLFKFAVSAYRETNRIESITKSPLLNYINETFNGVSTVRAFNKSEQFEQRSFDIIDKNILANQLLVSCWCWYGIRMDLVSITLMSAATFVVILYRQTED